MPRSRHPERVRAALAVIERRGRILICRRPAGAILGGYWEFPGGKLIPPESWSGCLRRELWEELGVRVSALRQLQHVHHRDARGADRFFVVYRCIMLGAPRPRAATSLRWIPRRHLGRYRFPPASQPILARLRTAARR
jgi:8-oxo-dGTP diphosphatase